MSVFDDHVKIPALPCSGERVEAAGGNIVVEVFDKSRHQAVLVVEVMVDPLGEVSAEGVVIGKREDERIVVGQVRGGSPVGWRKVFSVDPQRELAEPGGWNDVPGKRIAGHRIPDGGGPAGAQQLREIAASHLLR